MGKIEIDHNGSGSGITLSSDGTSLLLGGTAIGGGGGGDPDLYRDNASSETTPVASGTNAVAIGTNSQATGNQSSGLGSNARAVGLNSTATTDSYASGTQSFAAGMDSNSSSYGAHGTSTISMGRNSKASATGAVAIGYIVESDGFNTTSIGREITNTKNYSYAFGLGAKNDIIVNKFTFANGKFSANGDAQTSKLVLRSDTTDATAEALTTNNSTASSDNQVVLPNNSAYAFSGTIVARQKASEGTASAAWKVEGLIRREGSAGTTVLVNSATTVLDNTPSWGMALSADTTNGCLKIAVNGAASTNVRFVATIHTSEVTYA